jgi:SAM-dependent methyltransferase
MPQLTTGIRAILSIPWVYDFFQDIAGAGKFRKVYTSRFICPAGSDRILDIGCGTADILTYLPETVNYVGFDASHHYIEAARDRFGSRGQFHFRYVNEMMIEELGAFDIVMANGLIHHLNDEEARNLCRISFKALKPGGRMVTHDPCYSDRQSSLARYIISRDRGQNVRSGEEYAALLRPFFQQVQLSVQHDLARIPYTHAIMVGRKQVTT